MRRTTRSDEKKRSGCMLHVLGVSNDGSIKYTYYDVNAVFWLCGF